MSEWTYSHGVEPLVGEFVAPRPRLFKITDPNDETYVCYVPISQVTAVNVTDVGTDTESVSFLVGPYEHLVVLDTDEDVARFWEQWEIV